MTQKNKDTILEDEILDNWLEELQEEIKELEEKEQLEKEEFDNNEVEKLQTERLILIPFTTQICKNLIHNDFSDLYSKSVSITRKVYTTFS